MKEQQSDSRLEPSVEDKILSGSFDFTWHRHKERISWVIDGPFLRFDDPEQISKLSVERQIELFNKILGPYRQKSEVRDGFKTAAIAITEDGNYYIGHVIDSEEIIDPFRKGCAEDNVVRAMVQHNGKKTKIETFVLMAGRSNPSERTDKAELELPSLPCGACSDTLSRCCTQGGATLIALPPNDGSLGIKINTTAQNVDELQSGETWLTGIKTLLINSEIALKGKAKRAGKEAWQELVNGRLEIKDTKLKDSSLSEINNFMVKEIVGSYRKRQPTGGGFHNVQKVRCVVARLANGEFRHVTEIKGPEDNSVPQAEATVVAVAQASAERITDVWVMEMDPNDIAQNVMHTSSKEGLERIYKRRPLEAHNARDYSGKKIKENVNMHYIPFNSGDIEDHKVKGIMKTFDIEDLFASRFKGSKYINNYGNGIKGVQ